MEKAQLVDLSRSNKFVLTETESAQLLQAVNVELAAWEPLLAVDTRSVLPLVYITPQIQVLREDRVEQTVSREQILAIAPQVAENSFVVPRVAE